MKLKTISLAALSAISFAGSASAADIAGGNGSFETVTTGTVAAGGAFGQIFYLNEASFSGWTYTERVNDVNGAVWLMTDTTYGAASDGNNQVNVISAGTSYFLSTSISGLTIGNSYTVYFDARQRSGGGGNFDVVVDTTVPTGGFNITPTSTTWAQQSITFQAEATSHTLKIANFDYDTGAATTSGNGLFVDNFSVVPALSDANGIWTGADGNWSDATKWDANTIAQGIDKTATFNGLSPVIATVDSNRSIGALLFSVANHTIAAGAGSLTLDGATLFATPTVTVAGGVTATIAATLNGSEGLLKDGGGTLVLPGVNPYTGGTSVANGTLRLELAGRTGNDPIGSFDVSSGATLNLDNTNTTVGGASELYPANFILTGDGTLTKTNIGSIDFWNGSSLTGFTGTVDVQDGALRVNNITTGANMDSATLNIASGATFDVRYNASLSVDKLTGAGTLDQTFDGGSGLSVTVGLNDGSSTFDGVIQNSSGQPLALTKSGAGTFTLTGSNTYTGDTVVNGGTLVLADDAQLKLVVTEAPAANMVTGTGTAILSGDFNIDTTGVSGTTGHIWLLVDVPNLNPASSFTSTFSVIGFSDPENDGIWTMTDAKGDWTFSEINGELSLDVGTDYDEWGTPYGLATGTEGGDLDNDGLTNFEEYAFGLIPNSGSSVNAIVTQLDKTSGTFSYNRRLQSLTDLTYTVRSSTTLAANDWINLVKDTDYTEAVSPPSGGNETVTITLTPAPTASKLFIQVKAE